MGKKQMNVKPETGRALRDRELCYREERLTDSWAGGLVLSSGQPRHSTSLSLSLSWPWLLSVARLWGPDRRMVVWRGRGQGWDITTYPPCPVCWVWSWPAAAHPPHTEHTLSWPARQHLTGHVLHNTHNVPLSHLQRHTRTLRRHLLLLTTSAS